MTLVLEIGSICQPTSRNMEADTAINKQTSVCWKANQKTTRDKQNQYKIQIEKQRMSIGQLPALPSLVADFPLLTKRIYLCTHLLIGVSKICISELGETG